MQNPVIVIATPAKGSPRVVHLSDNITEGETAFEKAARDEELAEVALFASPQPRRVAAPSSNAEILRHSLASQKKAEVGPTEEELERKRHADAVLDAEAELAIAKAKAAKAAADAKAQANAAKAAEDAVKAAKAKAKAEAPADS